MIWGLIEFSLIAGFLLFIAEVIARRWGINFNSGKLLTGLAALLITYIAWQHVGWTGIGAVTLGVVGFCILVPSCVAAYFFFTRDKSNDAVDRYIKSQQDARRK